MLGLPFFFASLFIIVVVMSIMDVINPQDLCRRSVVFGIATPTHQQRPHMIPLLVAMLLLEIGSVYAQVAIEPDSPTWGSTITVFADPSQVIHQTQRFYKSDAVFAELDTFHQGLIRRQWV